MKLFDFRTREQLFQASFTDNETVIFEFDLSLNIPFFVNPLVKDTGSEVKWVRHGIALKDDGEIMTSGVAKIEHTNPTFLANGE